MIKLFFAKLFNWELVALTDFDGEISIRKVIETDTVKYVWRVFGIRLVELLPNGKTSCCYVTSWKTIRHKI